jgi:hypothetical protein
VTIKKRTTRPSSVTSLVASWHTEPGKSLAISHQCTRFGTKRTPGSNQAKTSVSGSSEAWYRARFGTGRSRVQIPVIRKYSHRTRIRRDCGQVRESQVSRRAGCGAPGRAGSAMENRTTRPAAAACRRRTGGRPSRPVVISEVRRSKVAVLAWGRPAAWKGMLSLALRDDQKAKNEAVFSYQFSYQLAHGTGQKLSNFAPVHSVRDRGVGGSNPLAPTNNTQQIDEAT